MAASAAAQGGPPNDAAVVDEPLATAALALASRGAVAPFGRPMALRSDADAGRASATLLALTQHPLPDVAAALADAEHWCALLILHLNNKGCSVVAQAPRTQLRLVVARRHDQPAEEAGVLDFRLRVAKATASELSVRLEAPSGPYGMRDCSIDFDAVAAGPGRTAIRMRYAFSQGGLGSLALSAYFATAGRDKVGFSPAAGGDGSERLVGGVRGLLERNLMRYFLAVEAAAATPQVSDAAAYERRLRDWFAATERYARQLHELDLDTYLALKRPLQAVAMTPAASATH